MGKWEREEKLGFLPSLCPPPDRFAFLCGQPDTTGETKTPPERVGFAPYPLSSGCQRGTGIRNPASAWPEVGSRGLPCPRLDTAWVRDGLVTGAQRT